MWWYLLLQKYSESQVSFPAGQVMNATSESTEDPQKPLHGKTCKEVSAQGERFVILTLLQWDNQIFKYHTATFKKKISQNSKIKTYSPTQVQIFFRCLRPNH